MNKVKVVYGIKYGVGVNVLCLAMAASLLTHAYIKIDKYLDSKKSEDSEKED